MKMRKCSKCGKLKSLDNFYKDRSKTTGYKSQCKECLNTVEKREYSKNYRNEHKDYFREKHFEYRNRNREKLREESKKRRLENPGETHDYYLKNRDKILTYSHAYNKSLKGRALRLTHRIKRRALAQIGDKDITLETLYNRDLGICALCGERCDYTDYIFKGEVFIAGNRYPSIDHIVPISKGGSHTWDNVQLAHKQCNSVKSNKI